MLILDFFDKDSRQFLSLVEGGSLQAVFVGEQLQVEVVNDFEITNLASKVVTELGFLPSSNGAEKSEGKSGSVLSLPIRFDSVVLQKFFESDPDFIQAFTKTFLEVELVQNGFAKKMSFFDLIKQGFVDFEGGLRFPLGGSRSVAGQIIVKISRDEFC